MTAQILHIAIFAPLRPLFDYLPCNNQSLEIGMRVKIPFGRTKKLGVIFAIDNKSNYPINKLKKIIAILDQESLLKPIDLKLIQWAIHYYHCYPADALAVVFPKNLRIERKATKKLPSAWQLSAQGRLIVVDDLAKKAPKQAAILNALQSKPLEASTLRLTYNITSTTLKILHQKEWIEPCEITTKADQQEKEQPPILHQEQADAVNAVKQSLGTFQAFLLDGITGSGKTEVYLTLIQTILEKGQQILVLVPEISLTPQLLQRFQRRLNAHIAIIHSALNHGEKEQAWQQCRTAKADVLIGTRSAVFTPLPNLGLVIIDEEHDGSFKQQQGFRYSARDLVIIRCRNLNIPVILGSATPSLESLYNVQRGVYQNLELRQRAGNAVLPTVQLLDIRDKYLEAGMSQALLEQIETELKKDNQVLIFLNRRGFAPVVICNGCGWIADCEHCDSHITFHYKNNQLICHHCGYQRPLIPACPDCGSHALIPLGQGTQRLEKALEKKFEAYPLIRIDRDTTIKKGSLAKMLDEIKTGQKKIILGTQMLAKGHHFPDVTLVVLLDIDQGLFGVDYRSTELMAQLLTQVSGRAGRAEKKGHVVIQTRHPDHPLLLDLIENGYQSCAKKMLIERQEAELPPYSYQALMRADAKTSELAHQFLQQAAQVAAELSEEVHILGPIDAPLHRKSNIFRAQLLIQTNDRKALHHLLHHWVYGIEAHPLAKKIRWSLDIDPKHFF